jgi:hypothetical protein
MEEKSLEDLTLRELADQLRSKLAAEEKKAESAAVLVQPTVVMPEAPTPSSSLLLAAPTIPLPKKKTKKKKHVAAPLQPPTHCQPMAYLLCCGVRRKCKISRRPRWPITSCAYGVKKGAVATIPCWFLMKLATSPSDSAPSHQLIFHRCWDVAHVGAYSSRSFPWEPGGTAILVMLLQSMVTGEATLWQWGK